ncbi:MAG TPA: hypothetical protein VLY21_05895 [Nitrososphaerales archaeon]|nr:hypothetical protein [Nitrososphaerales archaeon]
MTLELRLVRGNTVLFSVPVYDPEGTVAVERDIEEEDFGQLTDLYSMAANGRRLRMMVELMKRGEMRFSDMMELALNPKLVKDCVEPMVKAGLVTHEGRGTPYRPTEMGVAIVIAMTSGMGRFLDALEEEMEAEELE